MTVDPGAPAMAHRAQEAPETREPFAALVVGGLAGAIGFALCALWLGAPAGIVIALAATLLALAHRSIGAAGAFVAAGALSALALRPSTGAVFLAAVCFAAGLALVAKAKLLA